MRRNLYPLRNVFQRVLLLLAVFAGAAPAQLAGNDWMTAGGYGNLFVRDGEGLPAEQRALAELFATLWRKATGHEVERALENVYGHINVVLGTGGINEDMVREDEMAALGRDGYFLSTYTPSARYAPYGAVKQLVIAGNNPASTHMGVYGFFRRAFDSEWLAPGLADLRRAGYRFEKRREFVAPGFAFREVGFPVQNTPDEREFRLANGLPPLALGPWELHTWERWMTAPEESFLTPATREKPLADMEICPSAEGVAEMLADRLHGNKPADELDTLNIWPIAPKQPHEACTCAACSMLAETEGSPLAGWINLANRTAALLKKRDMQPPYTLLLHASGAHLMPPKTVRPADNVIIALSTERCDFSAPFADATSGEAARFAKALAEWGRVGARVWVFDHLGSNHPDGPPFPVVPVLQENLRHYLQHHVEGVYFRSPAPRETNDDFSALKRYVAARLLFEPDADVGYLTERFLAAAYGPAAQAVREYLGALKPLPGLMPESSAQEPLLAARTAGQAALAKALEGLAEPYAARVRVLLP